MTFDDICNRVYNSIGAEPQTTGSILERASDYGLTRHQVRGALWYLFNEGKIHISDKWVVTRLA